MGSLTGTPCRRVRRLRKRCEIRGSCTRTAAPVDSRNTACQQELCAEHRAPAVPCGGQYFDRKGFRRQLPHAKFTHESPEHDDSPPRHLYFATISVFHPWHNSPGSPEANIK